MEISVLAKSAAIGNRFYDHGFTSIPILPLPHKGVTTRKVRVGTKHDLTKFGQRLAGTRADAAALFGTGVKVRR